MNESTVDGLLIETEQYEPLGGAPGFEISRREFFRLVGGGVVVALFLRSGAEGQPPGRRGRGGGGAVPQEIGAWIHIAEDGAITVYTGKVEIGQNIRTSLTQVVAEELHVPMSRIHIIMGDTALTPFDSGTAGSATTPRMASQLRRAAAAAREALIDLAAEQTMLDRRSLTAVDGRIVGPRGEPSLEYGRLTKGRKLMKAIGEAPSTPPEHWTVAGASQPKVDGEDFVKGAHQYASDVRRPGMLFGKVLRPPAYKSTLRSLETRAVEASAGVRLVREGEFVGVCAPTVQAAADAVAALNAEWNTAPQITSDELFKHLKESRPVDRGANGGGGRGGATNRGSMEAGLKAADKTLKATYSIAYIAHVPLEPRAAVAEWSDGKLTVWTGTQRPFGVRSDLAAAFAIPPERVRVIVPDMGSGYGGKHTGEAAFEAAKLSKAVGKPVKLVWTREEEFTWAYFRPAGVVEVNAGVTKEGVLTAWEFHNYNSGASAIRTPYEAPNQRLEFHAADSPLRQGSYRGLAATANHFVRESHMDDLAHAVGLDPLAFRFKNLKDDRFRAVLEAAAKQFRWGSSNPSPGKGFGIAGGTEKGSYVATCAEVSVDRKSGKVQVLRLATAFECGAVLNPDHLKNQIEGAAMMGLGGALFEEVEFAEGKILNPSFSGYRVPRFKDAPILETVLLNRKDLPSAGAGETPIVAIAPAIGNAIYNATGVRLRALPMVKDGFKAT